VTVPLIFACNVQRKANVPAFANVRLIVVFELTRISAGADVLPLKRTSCANAAKMKRTVPPLAMSMRFGVKSTDGIVTSTDVAEALPPNVSVEAGAVVASDLELQPKAPNEKTATAIIVAERRTGMGEGYLYRWFTCALPTR
jgi:hypothetical protein